MSTTPGTGPFGHRPGTDITITIDLLDQAPPDTVLISHGGHLYRKTSRDCWRWLMPDGTWSRRCINAQQIEATYYAMRVATTEDLQAAGVTTDQTAPDCDVLCRLADLHHNALQRYACSTGDRRTYWMAYLDVVNLTITAVMEEQHWNSTRTAVDIAIDTASTAAARHVLTHADRPTHTTQHDASVARQARHDASNDTHAAVTHA